MNCDIFLVVKIFCQIRGERISIKCVKERIDKVKLHRLLLTKGQITCLPFTGSVSYTHSEQGTVKEGQTIYSLVVSVT